MIWNVPTSAEPIRPPRFWVRPNSTEKLIRAPGLPITVTIIEISDGPMNSVPPNASRLWLRYICSTRVWLVACASIQAPSAISSSAMTCGAIRCFTLTVRADTTMPATVAASTHRNSDCIWLLSSPTARRKPTAPTLCSDSTMRTSSSDSATRRMLRLVSQRRLSSGFARLCSTHIAAASRKIDTASATPIHACSVHQKMRPNVSTMHSSAMPGANNANVTKSVGRNALIRSPGGNLSSSTAPSDTSARPSSNMYRPRHSAMRSRSPEKI